MNLLLDLQVAVEDDDLPSESDVKMWVNAALERHFDVSAQDIELTVRVVDESEGTALNRDFRGKTGPTNVLSFPFEAPVELPTHLLGDIVICAPVLRAEAAAQEKPLSAHWAHLIVHGVLHLCGLDHQNDEQAREMEALECLLLAQLGFPDPYRDRIHNP